MYMNFCIWLFLVFRTPHSALCQVVTVRVCRSPHVVCQAVHIHPGNKSFIQMCLFHVCAYFLLTFTVTKETLNGYF